MSNCTWKVFEHVLDIGVQFAASAAHAACGSGDGSHCAVPADRTGGEEAGRGECNEQRTTKSAHVILRECNVICY